MEIVQSLLTKMGIFHKPQIKALTTVFATILIACGKVNNTQLEPLQPTNRENLSPTV
ncbi:hypothetical protein [Nostoc sp.]|uniref:hypothetical protein n=1 Tax=Nostoc sp. TaxID=1180 RepID=UPI002FFC7E19